MHPSEYSPGFYNCLVRWIQHRLPVNSCSNILPVGVKTTWPYEHSSVFVRADCRVTWHNLDQFPPGQDGLGPAGYTTVLTAFSRGLSPVWSDVSSAYQFTLAKVVPDIEHSGRTLCGRSLLILWPSYTRLPGQETTVSATRLRCSFSMGTKAEWLIPAVERPLTATIMSPHLQYKPYKEMMWYKDWKTGFYKAHP